MINPKILKLFGFHKVNPKHTPSGMGKGAWYNPMLELFYSPRVHSDSQFAVNLLSQAAYRAIDNGKWTIDATAKKIIGG
jgi:hypothetical protein